MRFVKMHGLGNDFLLVDPVAERIPEEQFPGLARMWCDRHFGVGADGLILVLTSQVADMRMRIFNPDGSEAEMCGNGVRCFGKFVYERGIANQNPLTVETMAGLQRLTMRLDNYTVETVEVDMGEPRLRHSLIPMTGTDSEQVVNVPLVVGNEEFRVTCVSMGNPHCVVFVEDVDAVPLEQIGPKIENHDSFPERTNVHFVKINSTTDARMRVWERGAGITLACGTGACAVLVAGVLNQKLDRRATLHLPGGPLCIEWTQDNHVRMTGPATEVYEGETV